MRIRRYRTPVCWLSLVALILCLTPITAFCEEGVQEMKLKRSFLRSVKFSVGDGQQKPVHGFLGLSFKRDFVDVMSAHPAALEQAERSLAWGRVGLGGTLTFLAGLIWLVASSSSGDGGVGSGPRLDSPADWMTGVGAVAAVVCSARARSSLNRAVEMYNEAEGAQGSDLTPGLSRRFLAERGPKAAAFYRDALR